MSRRTEYTLPNGRFLQTYNDNPDTCTVAIFNRDRLSKDLEPFFSIWAKNYPTVGYFYVEVPYSVVMDYVESTIE